MFSPIEFYIKTHPSSIQSDLEKNNNMLLLLLLHNELMLKMTFCLTNNF
jgi:hypothetical protein